MIGKSVSHYRMVERLDLLHCKREEFHISLQARGVEDTLRQNEQLEVRPKGWTKDWIGDCCDTSGPTLKEEEALLNYKLLGRKR